MNTHRHMGTCTHTPCRCYPLRREYSLQPDLCGRNPLLRGTASLGPLADRSLAGDATGLLLVVHRGCERIQTHSKINRNTIDRYGRHDQSHSWIYKHIHNSISVYGHHSHSLLSLTQASVCVDVSVDLLFEQIQRPTSTE